uniref:Prostaglandin E synthase 2 n=1 Tax=Lygus hesperus TaxID=30085 RepID=A0A0A9YLS4_LYGHE
MYMVAKNITKPHLIADGYLKPDDDPKTRLHEELNRFYDEIVNNKEKLQKLKKSSYASSSKAKKVNKNHGNKTESEPVFIFHGGDKPDLVDMDVFGVLQSVRGHRVYNDIMNDTRLSPWLTEMDKLLGKEAYTTATQRSL